MSFKISTPEWLKRRHLKARDSVNNGVLELESQPQAKPTKQAKSQSHYDAAASTIIIESPIQNSKNIAKTTCPAYLSGDELIIEQPKCETIILNSTPQSQKTDRSQSTSSQIVVGTLNIPTKFQTPVVTKIQSNASPPKAEEEEEEPEEDFEEEEPIDEEQT